MAWKISANVPSSSEHHIYTPSLHKVKCNVAFCFLYKNDSAYTAAHTRRHRESSNAVNSYIVPPTRASVRARTPLRRS